MKSVRLLLIYYFTVLLFYYYYYLLLFSGAFLNFLEEELDKSAVKLDALAASLDQTDTENDSTTDSE